MPVRTLLPVAAPDESILAPAGASVPPATSIHNVQFLRSTHVSVIHAAPTRAIHYPVALASSHSKSPKLVHVHQFLLTLYPQLAHSSKGRKSRNSAPPIIEHWLRPHVLAGSRLFFWTSDAAIQKRIELLSLLSPADVEAYDVSLQSLVSSSTSQIYGAGLMEWIVYCDARRIPSLTASLLSRITSRPSLPHARALLGPPSSTTFSLRLPSGTTSTSSLGTVSLTPLPSASSATPLPVLRPTRSWPLGNQSPCVISSSSFNHLTYPSRSMQQCGPQHAAHSGVSAASVNSHPRP